MSQPFLLYIDILGFSDIVRNKPNVIPDLFRALDNSPAHRDQAFKVIQFSDTVLVYNDAEAKSAEAKRVWVMYLCEFAQHIQYMLLGRDVFIRALITRGAFDDTGPTPNQSYQHIRAFWGEAMINAYNTEKNIQAVGLFVDKAVKPHMDVFSTTLYDDERGLWFADTATTLRNIGLEGDDFALAKEYILSTGTENLIAYDFLYLKRLFEHSHDPGLPPRVRNKYLTTWEIYRQKYPGFCTSLERKQFDFEKVIGVEFDSSMKAIGTPDGYFG
jgi:hypothetical protein